MTAFRRIKEAGIGLFAYDAESFGRSCDNQKLRSLVAHKDHLPDDVFAFVEVTLTVCIILAVLTSLQSPEAPLLCHYICKDPMHSHEMLSVKRKDCTRALYKKVML